MTPERLVRDVAAALEAWAPLKHAYDWDRVGLSIGNPGAKVSHVFVCLTVTRDAWKAAQAAGADMIVSHHPLIFRPFTALRTDVAFTKLCLDMAHAGVACYSAHTNLDVVPGGVSYVLAERLGLTQVQPLLDAPHAEMVKLVTFVPQDHLAGVREAVCAAGAGVIGDYTQCSFSAEGVGTFLPGEGASPFSGEKGRVNEEPERRFETVVPKPRLGDVLKALGAAHPYEAAAYDIIPLENTDASIGLGVRGVLAQAVPLDAFAAHVRDALGVADVRVVGRNDKPVQTVAAIGGSGGGELSRLPRDVDVCVTGDVKYHDALDALDRGLCVVDAGHAGTELPALDAIAAYLTERMPDVQVTTWDEPEIFRTLNEGSAP